MILKFTEWSTAPSVPVYIPVFVSGASDGAVAKAIASAFTAASASAPSDANAAFVAAFTAALEENARAGASASAGAGASDSAAANAIARAFASAGAGAYFDTSAALAAASTPTFAMSPRLREKVEDLQEALLEFQAGERARQKVDKEAADAHGAHCQILIMIRRSAMWMASLQARSLRLEMLPGQSPARAGACRRVQARVQEHIVQAKEQGEKLLALEASAKAEALSLLLERRERAGEETRLAVEDDLDDSDGELCFEDPRQATWADPPQDLREVTKDEAGTALRSLVRAAAGPELKFWAGVETTAGELAAATTSGAGLAEEQFNFKVFDPGG